MSKNEEMIKFVEANLKLEGMALSDAEKQTMLDCLTGKTTFDAALRMALARHQKAGV